jgi:hypothetical protein
MKFHENIATILILFNRDVLKGVHLIHKLFDLNFALQVQARECLFEKQEKLDRVDSNKIIENGVSGSEEEGKLIELSQEAQLLADEYTRVSQLLLHEELKEFIPPAWSSLVQVRIYES